MARLLAAICILLWSASGAAAQESGGPSLAERQQADEKALLTSLQDPELWSEPERRERLLAHLKQAQALSSPAVGAALAGRLCYSPFEGEEETEIRAEDRFPVAAVLSAVGIPMVPDLLELLRHADPQDLANQGQCVHNMAIRCLIAIYERGGHGAAMAAARIEKEIESSGGNPGFLKDALRHPRLKP